MSTSARLRRRRRLVAEPDLDCHRRDRPRAAHHAHRDAAAARRHQRSSKIAQSPLWLMQSEDYLATKKSSGSALFCDSSCVLRGLKRLRGLRG